VGEWSEEDEEWSEGDEEWSEGDEEYSEGEWDDEVPEPPPTPNPTRKPNPACSTSFCQGGLISVCVAPDDSAYLDGLRMNGIDLFEWIRGDGLVTQEAITYGEPASNYLTSYHSGSCLGGVDYCTFSTILYADFYASKSSATGAGSATMIFPDRRKKRRLGEALPDGQDRRVQEDPPASTFEISIPLEASDDRPAVFRTAGGVSLGVTALVCSMMALVSACLLMA
jgi:hypothetical protein